jgi:hypothetical protein
MHLTDRLCEMLFSAPRTAWRQTVLGLVLALTSATPSSEAAEDRIKFEMVPSAAAEGAGCLLDARANVTVRSRGPVERMIVRVEGLPPNTEFDLFVIQLPNAPFGLSWYQGDLETNSNGGGLGVFIGRFNIETFIVALEPPGPAPVVHEDDPFPDADENPTTNPVHTFHLGLWFNSPEDAAAAGCPDTVTPFNGDHTAGIQALSTRDFDDEEGPLRQLGS